MRVGLVTGRHQLDLQELPDPQPEPGKAVVQIKYCGICGTDLHAYQSGDAYNPAICGHEWSGTVSASPTGVDFKEGDRVAIGIANACGHCPTCLRGDAAHCETAFTGLIGLGPLAARHGGFASAIAIDASRLYAVVPEMDDIQAAMLEPATVAVHAVRRTDIRLGDTVVVIGAGPIGLLVLQCARAAGAGFVLVVEPQQSRRDLAIALGADICVDPTSDIDTTTQINTHLSQPGADVVFECAGIPHTIESAVEYSRRGGVVSLVGVPNTPSQINGATWLVKEVRLSTSLGYQREEFEVTQGLVADGRIQLSPMHTSTVGLEGMADAFTRLSSAPEEVKVLVDPNL